tara:strand:+ start:25575 stop:26750 length:1176 start_codon:yes stop_codon:yes gene_type:complete
MKLDKHTTVGVVGTGAMGTGIAQIAATYGHRVLVYDKKEEALQRSRHSLVKILNRLVEKGKYTQGEADTILSRIEYVQGLSQFSTCGLVIEAVVENLDIKKSVFHQLDSVTNNNCVLASNTSSLSIASIAADATHKERVLGIHFFNPAPLMPLVEIIPALTSGNEYVEAAKNLITEWGKTTVVVKDTPGFIVNRVARPYYGEALKMYEEGFADIPTIDWAMKEIGGFKMGPFELTDLIGHDVNYKVTETVWTEMYYDPRYKPSITQKRLVEAGLFGKKTGRGFYFYGDEESKNPAPKKDEKLGKKIVDRILVMLFNEAIDAVFLNIASKKDIDLAMTKGVNYPKGLLKWADQYGLEDVLEDLEDLQETFGDDRYRPSPLLRKMVKENASFY